MRSIFLLIALFLTPTTVVAEEAIIIPEEGSPLSIDSYKASYNPGIGRYAREGIEHKVTVRNTSLQRVLAYTVSFVSFDAFNEDMGRALGGVSINDLDVGASTDGTWRQNPYAAFTFRKHGTGVAYVSKVRLADGSIWRANRDFILQELRKIRSDLTEDIFENPKEGSGKG